MDKAPVSYKKSNISTNTTTLVKTGEGVLHTIVMNDQGASSNTIKLYDGIDANGTLFATIDSVTTTGTLLYDAQLLVGLCIVTATGTAGDITVMYRRCRTLPPASCKNRRSKIRFPT